MSKKTALSQRLSLAPRRDTRRVRPQRLLRAPSDIIVAAVRRHYAVAIAPRHVAAAQIREARRAPQSDERRHPYSAKTI